MNKELVIVLDFGGQYNQLVARRVRECNVYCEIYSYKTDISKIKEMNPKGIILTGGPNSLDGQFKLVCCRIDGWIKLKEGCSYAFFEKCKGIIIDGDGQQMFFTIMRKHSVPVITWCVCLCNVWN